MLLEKALTDILVEEGLITKEDLAQVLGQREDTTESVGHLLVRLGRITEKQRIACVGKQLSIPFIDLTKIEIDTATARRIPHSMAVRLLSVVVETSDTAASVAMVNPLDLGAIDDLSNHIGLEVDPYVATEEDVRDAIFRAFGAYDDLGEIIGEAVRGLDPNEIQIAGAEEEDPAEVNVIELREVADGAPVVKLVNALFARAIASRTSDIHIEPQQKRVRVRFRIDGMLQEAMVLPKDLQHPLVSRVKVMSGMDIAERRAPQDGRCTLITQQGEFDFRVSTYPTVFGENMVLRILDKNSALIGLERLGMDPNSLSRFERLIFQPHGMVLATGPTGSGKTTTLYAAIHALNSVERNVMTIEDPVEYQLPGVVQGNVNPKAGVTFASGLRTILRQDPDVLLVGEIRDRETAEIAIEAALTGHLVLSSLHSNDAPGAISRLVDMGIEPFLIASSLVGVTAQRLVRVVCAKCRQEVEPNLVLQQELGLASNLPSGFRFERGVGCDYCSKSGFRGRCGVYEMLEITPGVQRLILDNAPATEVRAQAVADGMRTLRDDAILKILQGVTTMEEVVRVTME